MVRWAVCKAPSVPTPPTMAAMSSGAATGPPLRVALDATPLLGRADRGRRLLRRSARRPGAAGGSRRARLRRQLAQAGGDRGEAAGHRRRSPAPDAGPPAARTVGTWLTAAPGVVRRATSTWCTGRISSCRRPSGPAQWWPRCTTSRRCTIPNSATRPHWPTPSSYGGRCGAGAWVHTDSAFVAGEVVEAFGADPDRVRVVAPGVPPLPAVAPRRLACRRRTSPARRAPSDSFWPSAPPSPARTSPASCEPSTSWPIATPISPWCWPARPAGARTH